jgi:Flp pilus assembly protein TadG
MLINCFLRKLNRKGQSIVEITLMTPLLLVALYVPFDFGMMLFTGHLTQNAVRDGARVASSTGLMDDTQADNLAARVFANLPQYLVNGTTTKSATVNYYATGAADCAQFVEVRAQGSYNFFLYRLIALFGFTPPNSVAISRTTRMRYESQPDANSGLCGGAATATGTHS